MPYIKEILKPHKCAGLPRPDIAGKKHLPGTKWQCNKCRKIYRLDYEQKDGWYWITEKEKE